jgi:CheY-like chemotaxis protein
MAMQGGKVLVVDDEPGIVGILAEVLQLDGHVVETVGNGKAALGKLALGDYELILSDIRMPEPMDQACTESSNAVTRDYGA